MWLDTEQTPEPLIADLAPDDVTMNSVSRQVQGDGIGDDPYSPAPHSMSAYGRSLTINEYVDWTEGGTYAPEYWLGYSTGMNPADFRSWAMTGEVAVPENQLAIALSERWGDVGEINLGNELVAGTEQNQTQWMPSEASLADLALIPGFGTGF